MGHPDSAHLMGKLFSGNHLIFCTLDPWLLICIKITMSLFVQNPEYRFMKYHMFESLNLKTAVEHIPANKNQHKLDKEN